MPEFPDGSRSFAGVHRECSLENGFDGIRDVDACGAGGGANFRVDGGACELFGGLHEMRPLAGKHFDQKKGESINIGPGPRGTQSAEPLFGGAI